MKDTVGFIQIVLAADNGYVGHIIILKDPWLYALTLIIGVCILNYCGVHPVARVSSNVNKPPYATMFGARFYCALTLHVSAPISGHLQVLRDKIYSKVATFMSTDPLSPHI
jgi:hypothetical protein